MSELVDRMARRLLEVAEDTAPKEWPDTEATTDEQDREAELDFYYMDEKLNPRAIVRALMKEWLAAMRDEAFGESVCEFLARFARVNGIDDG